MIDPAQLLGAWRVFTELALREGFTGLRVVVEMTWALAARVDELADYEAKSAELFATMPLHALCQYNGARFPDATLRRAAISTHPALLQEGGRVTAGTPEELRTALGWTA
jgi:hypothetical protein